MRTALRPGTKIAVNGIEYTLQSLLSASGGMSLIYEAQQSAADGGYAGKTVVKEFFPASNAARDADGRVVCASPEAADRQRFDALRRGMIEEGLIGEAARSACSQVYAFDQARDGYAVMRRLSADARPLTDVLTAWHTSPPATDEEYADMARVRYALRITHSLLTGLQTIHESAGIIHRDISLGNIVWASPGFEKDGRDGRAYFLDFGSALRMNAAREARNTSDPQSLLGTYSFAAPEIWQPGGTLTPAADLFSVSAVLLLLCCGKKCCIRMTPGWQLASQANVGRLYDDDFVVKTALQKLNIPPDIRGRLMDLLLEGLSKAPEKRFGQSALQMLSALEALQLKCAPRQRLREYAAFISYHHRPLDMAVARRLHREIEQYRIPEELAKDRESRRLGRVFRDEDELPVSTDLTDNIHEALDHSDWLIVICTPGTPGSHWVEQEIRYFLRHHNRNHILAVLAEGRPEMSFPPHLKHLFDADDRIIGDTEYLAANIAGRDLREVLHNLNREKLRIIAAMLGCPFDSLYQREKRYRLQRFAAMLGVGLLLILAYAGTLMERNEQISWRNAQLLQQKHEIQLSESRLLVKNAREAHESHLDADALRYALRALPADPADDRPYYAPAEAELLDYVGLLTDEYGRRQYVENVTLEYDIPVTQFEATADGRFLITLDELGRLCARDPLTGQTLWSQKVLSEAVSETANHSGFSKFILSEKNAAVVAVHDLSIACFSLADGVEKWRHDLNYSALPVLTLSVGEDYTALAVEANQRFEEGWNLIRDYDLVLLRTDSGEIDRRIRMASDLRFSDIQFEAPGSDADRHPTGFFCQENRCFIGYFYRELYREICLYRIDLERGGCEVLYTETTENSHEVIYAGPDSSGNAVLLLTEGADAMKYDAALKAIDLQTGEMLWRKDVEKVQDLKYNGLSASQYHVLTGNRCIIFSRNNHLYFLDIATGDVLAASSLDDTVTGLDWSHAPGYIEFTLANGDYGVGWINDYGFFDQSQPVVGPNIRCRMARGGFFDPNTEGNSIRGLLAGSVSEGFGYLVAQPEPSGHRLNVRTLRPRAPLEADVTVLQPDDDTMLNDRLAGAPIQIRQADILAVVRELSSQAIYHFTRLDRESLRPLERFSLSPEDYAPLYPLSGGTDLLQVDDSTGSVVRWHPGDGTKTVLAERQDEELSKTFYENISDYAIVLGPCTGASCARQAADGALLTAWCDGSALKIWLDGEPQATVPLPDPARWQIHDKVKYFRVLKCTGSGLIVLSQYAPDGEPEDVLEGFRVYDTRAGRWSEIRDEARGSSARPLAGGEQSAILAVCDEDGVIRLYDAALGTLLKALPANIPVPYVTEMKFVLEDRYLLLRTTDDRLRLVEVGSGETVYQGEMACSSFPDTLVTFDRSGRRVVLIDWYQKEGVIIDAQTWQTLSGIKNALAYDPGSGRLFLHSRDGAVVARKLPDLWGLMDIARRIAGEP